MPRRKGAKRGRKVGRSSRFQKRKGAKKRFTPRKMGVASRAIIRQPTGTPDSLYIKLRYSIGLQAIITGGAAVTIKFRGNGLYDPEFAVGGHQPYFFDQWATLYQAYTVLGSGIRVETFTNTGAVVPYDVVVVPSTTSTSYPSINDSNEQPYMKSKTMQYAQNMRPLKHYISTNKIIGIKKSQVFDDPNLSAAIGADPASQWYWHILFNTVDNNSDQALIGRCWITYYVRFFNRARPGQS